MADPFVHLHVHTEYSMLDGKTRTDELVDAVVADGAPGVAISDHGNLHAWPALYKAAKAAGITPIPAVEAYVAPEDHQVKAKQGPYNEAYYHLTVLATSNVGFANLANLSSKSWINGFYRKPRIDLELLETHAEGLTILSGCLGGEVCQHILHDNERAARETLDRYTQIFGADRVFVEVMDHGLPDDKVVNPVLVRLATDLGLRTVATQDSHYTHPGDAESHDALLCVGTASKIASADRFRFDSNEFWVKPAALMRALFDDFAPDACDSTLLIAEMVDVDMRYGMDLLPEYPCDEGHTAQSQLRRDVMDGAKRLYGDPLSDEILERIAYELDVIHNMGFDAYFLIVADFVRHAREVGIRVGPGRGSAAGAIVAYCTGITRVDPIRHGLMFERFLNPDRISMPDIDMDFDDRRRGEMIDYSKAKYGVDLVAQIATYSRMKAKQAIKDAARVLDLPYSVGDQLSKAFPPSKQGNDPTIADAREHEPFTTALEGMGPEAARAVDLAATWEGNVRGTGVHAAGVVIAPKPLATLSTPLMVDDDGNVVTQWELKTIEPMGYLKMDFLGLRNLTIISDAEELIRRNKGLDVDMDDPNLLGDMSDGAAYDLLRRGDTLGVFQLDSRGIRELVVRMQPSEFSAISAALALYRPGPMSMEMHNEYADRYAGRKPVRFEHDALEPILGETLGILVYQEQVQRCATDLAGFSGGRADTLRKAVGKKQADLMAELEPEFKDGVTTSVDGVLADRLWDLIVGFAQYGFNKAHTVSYGVISFQTAWLKAHYPTEYMAALLTSVANNKDSRPVYLAENRRMGIGLLPPSINASVDAFAADGDTIRYGLGAIKGIGSSVVSAVVAERDAHGPFVDFHDFVARLSANHPSVLNSGSVEALASSGAFDPVGHPRKGLTQVAAQILERAVIKARAEAEGQFSLFDAVGGGDEPETTDRTPVPEGEYDQTQMRRLERELLGVYVSSHPLDGHEHRIAAQSDRQIADLPELRDGHPVVIAGMISAVTGKTTRKGDPYAVAVLDDTTGEVDLTIWPKSWAKSQPMCTADALIVVEGKLEKNDDGIKVLVDRVRPFDTTMQVPESPEVAAMDTPDPPLATDPVRVADRPAPDVRIAGGSGTDRQPAPSQAAGTSLEPVGSAVAIIDVSPAEALADGFAGQIKALIGRHPGHKSVRVRISSPGRATTMKLPKAKFRVDDSNGWSADLAETLAGLASPALDNAVDPFTGQPDPVKDAAIDTDPSDAQGRQVGPGEWTDRPGIPEPREEEAAPPMSDAPPEEEPAPAGPVGDGPPPSADTAEEEPSPADQTDAEAVQASTEPVVIPRTREELAAIDSARDRVPADAAAIIGIAQGFGIGRDVVRAIAEDNGLFTKTAMADPVSRSRLLHLVLDEAVKGRPA
jgi:DNA polymerase-3 subunit alpha